jgi:hypothetical protein
MLGNVYVTATPAFSRPVLPAVTVTKRHMAAVGDLDVGGAQLAQLVKEEFDDTWGMKWHVMIGTSFGCHATHEAGCFVHFYVAEWAVMIFKA